MNRQAERQSNGAHPVEQQNAKGIKKIEDTLRDFWYNIKWNNIHIIGIQEGEERARKLT